MSLNKGYQVLPAIRIHYSGFKISSQMACRRALKAVNLIRRKDEAPADVWKGAVKLWFSWGAFGVCPFKGLRSLDQNVQQLFEQRDSENPTCMVQEFIPNVVCE